MSHSQSAMQCPSKLTTYLVCLISCHKTTVYVAEVCSVKLNRNACTMDDLHYDKFHVTLSIT